MKGPSPMTDLSNTVVIVGAGFSKAAKVPLASELSQYFLSNDYQKEPIQRFVSKCLRQFWEDVFGYDGSTEPSFEDHFTLLDLAANSGHNIGDKYTPAILRALRRLSIHRVFEILNSTYEQSEQIKTFLSALAGHKDSTLISLNWDIVVEKHLSAFGQPFNYGIDGKFLDDSVPGPSDFSLIKLHGSANWNYCDSCHSTLFGGSGMGKSTLKYGTFLESRDFEMLNATEELVRKIGSGGPRCKVCNNKRVSARVATFSYTKAFDFFPFHASWDMALQRLRRARRWIFIGYSLPDADFAFKHLLKTAQLAVGTIESKEIRVVDPSDTVIARYKKFFGKEQREVFQKKFEEWV
jgi:hypothetical protein